jgi:UDP-N-acetylmuramoylalanine--D-glutamate ligase
MMKNWKGKHLVIVGAARQGLALASFLSSRGTKVTITDQKDEETLIEVMQHLTGKNIHWVLGGHPLELLENADAVSLSGGIPLTIPFVRSAVERDIPITNDSQIFMEFVPCPVIGITGSAGKTTITLLVGRMIEFSMGGSQTWVGGNIGNPLIADVDRMMPDHLAVVELSSFQLEQMTISPAIACVTNLTPNHLDRHGTMSEYSRAKARILDFQTETDIAVLNREDPGSWDLKEKVKGKLFSFGIEKPDASQIGTYLDGEMISYWDGEVSKELFHKNSIKLRGHHNLVNVLCACAIALAAGTPADSIKNGVESLEGVEHRLEFVRSWGGASWINDTIATAPERSIAAIKSFDEPLVLLAGGRDKDLPWANFAKLVQKRVRHLILFGEAANLIEGIVLSALQEGERGVHIQKCNELESAVKYAAEIVEPGDVVLLSPGGTSFDQFTDFTERGEKFRQCVQELS